MELFRRYGSEIEQTEFQHQEYAHQLDENPNLNIKPFPTREKLIRLATDLNHVLLVVGEYISVFLSFIKNPKSVVHLLTRLVL
jgi:hypothetical protein